MLALVTSLAVVVLLLVVLVIGLLRSYGDVLRRLHELGSPLEGGGLLDDHAAIGARLAGGVTPPPSPHAGATGRGAQDLSGVTPHGSAVAVGVAGRPGVTLLAFLSSGCGTCGAFWEALRRGRRLEVGGGALRTVVVTAGTERESPTTVGGLAGPDVTVVMSTSAWTDYAVPATPYFVLVDGVAGVVGEGSALGWEQLAGLVGRAAGDAGFVLDLSEGSAAPARPNAATGRVQEERVDEALRAAGIGPGDPRLFDSSLGDVPLSPAKDAGARS